MLVLQHRSLHNNHDELTLEMKKKEKEHQAELTRVKKELARVTRLNELHKQDMELVLRDKATTEKQCDDLKIAMSKRA